MERSSSPATETYIILCLTKPDKAWQWPCTEAEIGATEQDESSTENHLSTIHKYLKGKLGQGNWARFILGSTEPIPKAAYTDQPNICTCNSLQGCLL